MKSIILVRSVILIIILWCGAALGQLAIAEDEDVIFEHSQLTITSSDNKNHLFNIEIATTDQQRARGLMFRKAMADDRGMLFLFETSQMVTMWMKNTYIPLDILFINQDGMIVHIAKSAVPESLAHISSIIPVISALELNGGVTDKLNIQVGDKIQHSFFTQDSSLTSKK